MIKQYKLRFYNFRLVFFLLAISAIGIRLVGTAMESLSFKQLAGAVMGMVLMLILSLVDYSWIMNFQWIMYFFNIVMLLGVRVFGDSANGAARWINLGFIRFQPTELSKIIIVVFFAKFFMDHEEDLNSFRTLAKSALLLLVPLLLIYNQPDMKNTITVAIVFCIFDLCGRTQLQGHWRRHSDRCTAFDHIFEYRGTAGSEIDQGLSA